MRAVTKVVVCAIVFAGCRGKQQEESAGDVAGGPATAAMAVTQAAWAPDALDELVAPIALYPDQLVGQILGASVNTQEVLDAGNWLLQNQTLKGDQLDAAAQKAGFGPATRALVQFPTVVDMMCQELDWTKQLGAAFTSDQKAVLDAIQRMRAQAADIGNLESTPQQTVERKQEGGKEIVEVKPADPKVVYVPQYDPTIIYTTPPPPAPAPAPEPQPTNTVSTGAAVAGGLLAFGVGVLVGSAINDNDYCYPSWGHGSVYYGPRPFYPPAYVYRPVYGPAFRPAYGYAPPAGYRNRYNSPTNIVINNNNYYNRFSNQNNIRVNQPRNAAAATRQAGAGNRAGSAATPGRGQDWKGQSSYTGARPGGANDRRATTNQRTPPAAARAPNASNRANATPASQRPGRPSQTPTPGTSTRNEVASGNARDRGYAAPTSPGRRDASGGAGATNRAQAAPNVSNASRDQPGRSEPPDNALSGASRQGTGSFDRSASARGHASTGASRERPARAGRKS